MYYWNLLSKSLYFNKNIKNKLNNIFLSYQPTVFSKYIIIVQGECVKEHMIDLGHKHHQ